MRSFQGLDTDFLVELVNLFELGLLYRFFQVSSSESHNNVKEAGKTILVMTRYATHDTHWGVPFELSIFQPQENLRDCYHSSSSCRKVSNAGLLIGVVRHSQLQARNPHPPLLTSTHLHSVQSQTSLSRIVSTWTNISANWPCSIPISLFLGRVPHNAIPVFYCVMAVKLQEKAFQIASERR